MIFSSVLDDAIGNGAACKYRDDLQSILKLPYCSIPSWPHIDSQDLIKTQQGKHFNGNSNTI